MFLLSWWCSNVCGQVPKTGGAKRVLEHASKARGSAWHAVLDVAPENSVTMTASVAGGLCDFAECGRRLVAA